MENTMRKKLIISGVVIALLFLMGCTEYKSIGDITGLSDPALQIIYPYSTTINFTNESGYPITINKFLDNFITNDLVIVNTKPLSAPILLAINGKISITVEWTGIDARQFRMYATKIGVEIPDASYSFPIENNVPYDYIISKPVIDK